MEITHVQWTIQDYLIIHSCYGYVSLPHWVVDLTNKISETSSSGGRIKPKYSPDFRFPQSQLVSMGESATQTGCIANTAQALKMTWVLNGEVTNDLHKKYGRSCSRATHTHTMLCHRSGLEKPCKHTSATRTRIKKGSLQLVLWLTYICNPICSYKSTNTRQVNVNNTMCM